MSLTVEEFNREVLNYQDFNYEPVVRYLIDNPYCDTFYNICKSTMEMFKARDSKMHSRRRKNFEYDSYEEYRDKKKKIDNQEIVKDEDACLNELANDIMSFRKRFRYFHFEKFFLMLMCNYRLLLDDEDDINKFYFRYDQQFKVDLLKRLDFYIASKDSSVNNYMHMRYMRLNPRKQVLFKSLNSIKDPLIFQLNGNINAVIGWNKKDSNYKYAKLCRDDNILNEYEQVFSLIKKTDRIKNKVEDDKKSHRNRYINLRGMLDDYMNDDEIEYIELIDFIERLSNEQTTTILKQIDLYRKLYDEL